MKRPAVFFDRDNTLIANDGYLGDPNGVVLVDGAADAVARARQYGFRVVTISNQSGVARGIFDEDAVNAVNARMDELLRAANPAAIIDRHEFCPYHPEASIDKYRLDSDLRKPKPGMILRAAAELNLDLSRSWVIGDHMRDVAAGHAAGCRTILFRSPDLKPTQQSDIETDARPDFQVSSLREAIDVVAREAFRQYAPPPGRAADPRPTAPGIADAAAEQGTAGRAEASAAARAAPAQEGGAPALTSRASERLLQQILVELQKRNEQPSDFSVSKLLAGIVQVLALAVLFVAWLNRDQAGLEATLLLAIMLQTLTVALLIMGRQR